MPRNILWNGSSTSRRQFRLRKTLADQDALLSKFNKLKEQFVEISPSSLNFQKMHSLQHVTESTRIFGTADNTDTETTEHQHRLDVKLPYQRTNKRDLLAQVVKFVERRTAFEDKLGYIAQVCGHVPP